MGYFEAEISENLAVSLTGHNLSALKIFSRKNRTKANITEKNEIKSRQN